MLTDLPAQRFRVFSGARPLATHGDFESATALIHADPDTADLTELIGEMADRTSTGYLFGGLASSRGQSLHVADGVWHGGISGVAFDHEVALLSRVTQGCQPVGPVRRITACEHNLVVALDGEPALDCLFADLQMPRHEAREILPRLRETLVGLSDRSDDVLSRPGQFGTDTRVRHLIGIDPGRRAIAVADVPRSTCNWLFVAVIPKPRAVTWCESAARSVKSSPPTAHRCRPAHRGRWQARSISVAPAEAVLISARRRRNWL